MKWAARITLAELAVGMLVALCLIPGHMHMHVDGPARGLTTVWPVPPSFGHHHPVADVLMGIGDVLVGFGVVALACWFIAHLVRLAR